MAGREHERLGCLASFANGTGGLHGLHGIGVRYTNPQTIMARPNAKSTPSGSILRTLM